MESEFVTVARLSDLPALGGLEVTVRGRRIVIFKTPEGLFATDAECPHKGGPLAAGWVENGKVYCPLHGWDFDLKTGLCTTKPAAVSCYRLRKVEDDIQFDLRSLCPES